MKKVGFWVVIALSISGVSCLSPEYSPAVDNNKLVKSIHSYEDYTLYTSKNRNMATSIPAMTSEGVFWVTPPLNCEVGADRAKRVEFSFRDANKLKEIYVDIEQRNVKILESQGINPEILCNRLKDKRGS